MNIKILLCDYMTFEKYVKWRSASSNNRNYIDVETSKMIVFYALTIYIYIYIYIYGVKT